jgi:hypothetical protein
MSPEAKRPKTNESEYSPRPGAGYLSENSRDRSNLGKSKAVKNARPVNNKTMHDFFQAATTGKRKKESTGGDTDNDSVGTSNSIAPTTAPSAAISTTTASTSNSTSNNNINNNNNNKDHYWHAKYLKLQQLLQDKDEQLKAVTNNKTILHTALQSALEKTKKELACETERYENRVVRTSTELEDLLRWKATRQAKEVREKMASDSARLGKIVVSRAGMRAVESWEEGYATRDMEHRKYELCDKRVVLEARLEATRGVKENVSSRLEAMEAHESVRMHLEGVQAKERELAEEEQALNDEKGAHIRALKRVASEDASRFRARPKVRKKKRMIPAQMRIVRTAPHTRSVPF